MSPATRKVTKETPLGEWEVSIKHKQSRIKNNQTVRLLLDFNISPSPKTPPPLRAHPLGSHERGILNRVKGILSPAPRTVAVISFEMKLKVSLCYMSWVQHYFNTNTTVRAFFCLQKKPSLTLNCAFFRGSSFGYFSFKKSNTHPLASPPNQNLKLSKPRIL